MDRMDRAFVVYEVGSNGRRVPFGYVARAPAGRDAVRRVRHQRRRRPHGWLVAQEAAEVPRTDLLVAWARGALHLVVDDELDDPPPS